MGCSGCKQKYDDQEKIFRSSDSKAKGFILFGMICIGLAVYGLFKLACHVL